MHSAKTEDQEMRMPFATQVGLIVGISMCYSTLVLAQDSAASYPAKPVRVIVATAAGGAVDIQARLFAQKLSENLRRTFVVENRPGAGNTIGTEYVARSAPDGYTLLAVAPGFTYSSALYKNVQYDPEKDFSAVSLLSKSSYLLVVHPSLPVKSVGEWIALAKARPGQLNAGVPSGAFGHLATIWLAESAKVKIQIIPYKGTGPMAIDLVAGELQMSFSSALANLNYVKLGKLKALGISTSSRSAILPGIPPIAEAIPAFELSSWHGWVAPAGTPAAIVDKLYAELAKVSKSPEISKALLEDGGEVAGSTPEQFRRLISAEIDRWRKVVVIANMTVQ